MAGEHQVGQPVGPEGGDLQHLAAGRRDLAVLEAAPVADPHHARSAAPADVIDAEQLGDLDLGADLLAALPDGCQRRVLVVVDIAARQAPEPIPRLDPPPADDDLAGGILDHHQRDHLGVVPEHEAAGLASLQVAALHDPGLQGAPAVNAVVRHRFHGRCTHGAYTRNRTLRRTSWNSFISKSCPWAASGAPGAGPSRRRTSRPSSGSRETSTRCTPTRSTPAAGRSGRPSCPAPWWPPSPLDWGPSTCPCRPPWAWWV